MVLQLPRSAVDPVDAVAQTLASRFDPERPLPAAAEALVAPLVRAAGGGRAPELEELAQAFGRSRCAAGGSPLEVVDDLLGLRAVLESTVAQSGLDLDHAVLDRTLRAAMEGALDVPRTLPATRDQVTGFLLPGVFLEVVQCEVDAASRFGAPTVLVVHAPSVAAAIAAKGRLAGDLLRVRLASALRATARRSDVLGLIDTDHELVGVLLPRTDALRAQAVVRRLLSRLETMDKEVRAAPARVAGLRGGRRGAYCVGVGYLSAPTETGDLLAAARASLELVQEMPAE